MVVLGDRNGEALLLGDLVGALLAHAEEFGDLDEPNPSGCHRLGRSPMGVDV
jgi:hypothetical protein